MTVPRGVAAPRDMTAPREMAAPRDVTAPREMAPPRDVTAPREMAAPRGAADPREMTGPRGAAAQHREAVTERLPVRPRQQQPAAAQARNGTPGTPGMAARGASIRPDATAIPPGGEPSLAMLASLASTPDGAFEDDPLTSPSFRPTPDSRSYRGARRSTRGGGTSANGSPAPAAGSGNGAAPHGRPRPQRQLRKRWLCQWRATRPGAGQRGVPPSRPHRPGLRLPTGPAGRSPAAGQLAQRTPAGEPVRQLRG